MEDARENANHRDFMVQKDCNTPSESKEEEDTMKTAAKSKKKKGGFRKAPQAPRRFKSPYILFSINRMAEYKSASKDVQVTSLSRQIAEEWKTLPEIERKKWNQVALQDKLRYNAEKRLYTGPWQVPSKRSRKDPSAPKRPPSAFLLYCKTRRSILRNQNPNLKNTDISKLLGQEWKEAPSEIRQPHIETEQREREVYKSRISKWREKKQEQEACLRKKRQAVTEEYIRSGNGVLPPINCSHSDVPTPWNVSQVAPYAMVQAPQGSRAFSPTLQYQNRSIFAAKNNDAFGLASIGSGATLQKLEGRLETPVSHAVDHVSKPIDIQAVDPPNALCDDTGSVDIGKSVPSIPFDYSNDEAMQDAGMQSNDSHLFPSFLQGDPSFDPELPIHETE